MKKMTAIITALFTLSAASSAQDHSHSHELVTVAALGKSMAIGLSVTSDNRVFVAFPDYNGAGAFALTEEKEGKIYPYPNKKWNTKEGKYSIHFLRVQDLYVDNRDNLWVLDSKPASKGDLFANGKDAVEGKFKLVKINTRTNQVEKIYFLTTWTNQEQGLMM